MYPCLNLNIARAVLKKNIKVSTSNLFLAIHLIHTARNPYGVSSDKAQYRTRLSLLKWFFFLCQIYQCNQPAVNAYALINLLLELITPDKLSMHFHLGALASRTNSIH